MFLKPDQRIHADGQHRHPNSDRLIGTMMAANAKLGSVSLWAWLLLLMEWALIVAD
jgi:hypothetical protein